MRGLALDSSMVGTAGFEPARPTRTRASGNALRAWGALNMLDFFSGPPPRLRPLVAGSNPRHSSDGSHVESMCFLGIEVVGTAGFEPATP